MSKMTIWHNPRCSKSRATLAILQENGVSVAQFHYLETPPTKADITSVLGALMMEAKDIVRTGEAVYKSLGLSATSHSDLILDALADNPILIERPIVVCGSHAIIGRPPENVLKLL